MEFSIGSALFNFRPGFPSDYFSLIAPLFDDIQRLRESSNSNPYDSYVDLINALTDVIDRHNLFALVSFDLSESFLSTSEFILGVQLVNVVIRVS